jgi:hypothetical protein
MKRSRTLAAIGVSATVALFAAGTAHALGARVPDPIPDPIPTGDITVGLRTVADGLANPVTATYAPGDGDHLYVAEQSGRIWQLDIGGDRDDHRGDRKAAAAPRLVADLSSAVIPLGCFGINYDERGLFGLAFHPDFKHNGLLYTYTSQTPAGQPALPANKRRDRVARRLASFVEGGRRPGQRP